MYPLNTNIDIVMQSLKADLDLQSRSVDCVPIICENLRKTIKELQQISWAIDKIQEQELLSIEANLE